MKKDEKKKIFERDSKVLTKEIFDLRSELAHLKLTFKSKAPKDVNVISNKKKKLAIMLTALRMSTKAQ